MKGDLRVQAEPGRGAKYTASCLQKVADYTPYQNVNSFLETAGDPSAAAPFRAYGYRVLVVDDFVANLVAASCLLAPFAVEVFTCLSGAEALEMEKSRPFDLIFLDYLMPELDGVATLKAIRALGGRRLETTVVAFTANNEDGIRETLLREGFNDFLSKPIDSAELTATLDRWIPEEYKKPNPAASNAILWP
jgi:CheY-like chemotaxis protein